MKKIISLSQFEDPELREIVRTIFEANEQLHGMLGLLQAQLEEKDEQLQEKDEQLSELRTFVYGRRSERIEPVQRQVERKPDSVDEEEWKKKKREEAQRKRKEKKAQKKNSKPSR